MAGLASGMLSHISSVLNSCSTVFTMDLYKPFFGRDKSRAAPGARRAAERVCDSGRGHAAGDLVQPPAARRVSADPECRRVGGGADRGGVPARRAVAANHGGGGDVRAAVRLPVTRRSSSMYLFKHVALADAVRQLAEPHVRRLADLDDAAGGGLAVSLGAGRSPDQTYHLVMASFHASVRGRAQPTGAGEI